MTILSLIVMLVVVGVVLWAVNAYVPMDQKIKTILNIVVVVMVVVYLLRAFGVLAALGDAPVPALK